MSSVGGLAAGTVFGGRYRITERIGSGGMAEVYLATAIGADGFERKVVVKRMRDHIAADTSLASAFLDEARLLARLNHPHVAQLLDLGDGPDGAYLVMEYVPGRDLREVMARARGPLDPGVAALIVRDVCEALDHGFQLCDDQGIPLKLIHRDISLSNVMVATVGVVKLVDFGIAKALTHYARQSTADGIVKGKFSYLAPEVLTGSPADHRSDIFSAGVVLFEILVGRKLYRASLQTPDLLAEREAIPPAPSSIVPRVPRELDQVVARALSRDPSRRYATAEAMAAALDEVVHRCRTRPPQLAELMTQLFDPSRLRSTSSMAIGPLEIGVPPDTDAPPPSVRVPIAVAPPDGIDGPMTTVDGPGEGTESVLPRPAISILVSDTEANVQAEGSISGAPTADLDRKAPTAATADPGRPRTPTPTKKAKVPPMTTLSGIGGASTAILGPRKNPDLATMIGKRRGGSGATPMPAAPLAETVMHTPTRPLAINPWYIAAVVGALVLATATALVVLLK